MKNKVSIVFGLMLFITVLMGVILIKPFTEFYPSFKPFIPIIVLTGFFTFLVSVGLFIYGFISILRKK